MARAAVGHDSCCLRPPEICSCLRTLPAASARDLPCGQTHSQSPSTPTHSIQRRSATHRKTARNHRQPSKTTKQTCLHAILPRLSCSLSPNHPRFGQLLRFSQFTCQPFSLPLLLRIPPPPQPQLQPRAAPTQHFLFTLSHRIASQTCPKRPTTNNPSAPRYTALLPSQRDTLHFGVALSRRHYALLDLAALDLAPRRHALRPPVRRAPCFLRLHQLYFLVFRFTTPCLL